MDDDYLIGLSNKGIVKRAYKDKGEVAAQVQSTGEEASVAVGEETVTLPPWGEQVHLPVQEHLPPCGAGHIGFKGKLSER